MIRKDKQGYLKFNGKYSELKNMGYKFHKLFAGNYMSWNKCGIYIYKKGADLTHGEFDLYKLLKFLDSKPQVRKYSIGIVFYKFYTGEGVTDYEFRPYNEETLELAKANMLEWMNFNKGDDYTPQNITTVAVSNELREELQRLRDLGWIEYAEYEENE